MKDVKVIEIHTGMANIKCIVKPSINVNEISLLLTSELSKLHTEVPKTIIYSHKYWYSSSSSPSYERVLGNSLLGDGSKAVRDILIVGAPKSLP